MPSSRNVFADDRNTLRPSHGSDVGDPSASVFQMGVEVPCLPETMKRKPIQNHHKNRLCSILFCDLRCNRLRRPGKDFVKRDHQDTTLLTPSTVWHQSELKSFCFGINHYHQWKNNLQPRPLTTVFVRLLRCDINAETATATGLYVPFLVWLFFLAPQSVWKPSHPSQPFVNHPNMSEAPCALPSVASSAQGQLQPFHQACW